MQASACVVDKAACDLQAILRLLGRSPALYHIRSTRGIPSTACQMALQSGLHKTTLLEDASAEGLLPWFWTLFARDSLPQGLVHGKICDAVAEVQHSTLSDALEPFRQAPKVRCELSFVVLTYNCLTAASTAQRESLDAQFDRKGIAVAILQETRSNLAGRSQTAHYHVLSALRRPMEMGVVNLVFQKGRHQH